jgi:biopolymer transport protein ExbD
MASAKLRNAAAGDDSSPAVDMSPMIDMVFLLLIFFMVTAQLTVNKKDINVKPPVALDAVKNESASGRFVINILEDGTITQDEGGPERTITEEQVTQIARAHADAMKSVNVTPRLQLRADKNARTEFIKRVVKAAGAGGVSNVIFSSIAVEP